MALFGNPTQWILGFIIIISSLGVITLRKPVHASLCFLLTLLTLATMYLQLSASFIAVMQVLVYAGAILVIFMFVLVLFQDAYVQIHLYKPQSNTFLLVGSAVAFALTLGFLGSRLTNISNNDNFALPQGFGDVETIGKALYLDFFFPFEAVILIFLVAVIGALYIGKKEK